ncbi:MAG: type II toxin-antitoxin system VapC family toxin [Salaquimonas sp.]|jgi:predicted nucleic-acid-binding protein|nr:type II toxin-antitoxin system VapC family toxin [Salaquimonas sp.]
MKAVDTNVLLRQIVRDDPEQFEKTSAFFSQRTPDDPAYVSLIVLAELVWALRYHYRYRNTQVQQLLAALVETRELVFEDEQYLPKLLRQAEDSEADIADYLIAHVAERAGCESTVTFDRRAAKSVPGMELLA